MKKRITIMFFLIGIAVLSQSQMVKAANCNEYTLDMQEQKDTESNNTENTLEEQNQGNDNILNMPNESDQDDEDSEASLLKEQTDPANASTESILDVLDQEDISLKLQAAIKAGCKHIFIPQGEYYCTGVNLNSIDGLTIEAAEGTIIKQCGSNPILCVANSYAASNITIKGGVWDGNNVETPVMRFYGDINGISFSNLTITGSTDCGIRFNNSKSVKLENTTVQNCGSYAVLCDNVDTLTITNSKMNTSKSGLTLRNGTGSVYIEKSECDSNTEYGILASDCADITMLEVTASENNAGVRVENNVGKISMKKIYAKSNNTIGIKLYRCSGQIAFSRLEPQNNGNSGLVLEECTGNATVYKSYAYSNGNIGIDIRNCAYVKINGCLVKYNTNYGINVDGNIKPDNASWALKVIDTTIQKNNNIGLRIVNMPDKNNKVNIDANTVSNENGSAGFYAENIGFIIFNKVLAQKNKGFGINVNQGKSVTIASSDINKNTDAGARLSACNKSKMTELTVNANGKSGIIIKNSKNGTFTNITVTDNKDYGLNFNEVTGTNKLSGITAAGNANSGYIFINSQGITMDAACSSMQNGAHGIYITDSKVALNGVDIEDNYWCGVSVTGSVARLNVNGGSFMANGTRPDQYEDDDNLCAGIGVYGGATAKIIEAACNKNHGCGITAAGSEDGSLISSISVYGCTVNENGDHGIGARPYGKINITKSSNNVENVICNNKYTGFILNDHCSADFIEYCTINENGKAGISISENSSADQISHNSIIGNKEDGIHVSEGSRTSIASCELNHNAQSGIGIYSNSTVDNIDACNINENEHYGICVDAGDVAKISDSTITKNIWAGVIARNKSKVDSISGITSQNNETYGLYVSNGSTVNDVSSNFNQNTKDGIRVTDKNTVASVKKSKCNNNKDNGVAAVSGAKVNINGTTVSNNSGYGIYVAKAANAKTIKNLTISGNGSDGIRITGDGTKATLISNANVTNNGKCGLVLTANAVLAEMKACTFEKNQKHGVAVYKGTTSDNVSDLISCENGSYQVYVEEGAITCLEKQK